MKYLVALALLFLIGQGCSSGISTPPVELPIPFSGNLTTETRIFAENGLITHTPQGVSDPLVDSLGLLVGHVDFDFTEMETIEVSGNVSTFIIPFTVDIGDGNTVTAEKMKLILFVSPEFEPSITQEEGVQISGDPNAVVVVLTGVGSATITSGTGVFSDAVGGTIEYRPSFTTILLSDGGFFDVSVDLCGCLVNLPGG